LYGLAECNTSSNGANHIRDELHVFITQNFLSNDPWVMSGE